MQRRANGEGHFWISDDNKVHLRKMVGRKQDGKPIILTVSGTSKKNCLEKMKSKEKKYRANYDNAISSGILVSELCIAHLKEHLSQKDRIKPKAADRRESTIRNQIKPYLIGRLQAETVRPVDVKEHIEMLIDTTELSVSSIKKALDVINSAYNWAIGKGVNFENPVTPVKDELTSRLSKLDEKRVCDADVIVLTDEEFEKIKEIALTEKPGGGYYTAALPMLLLYHTGMRIGEICALRWEDFNSEISSLSISKTRYVKKNRDDMDKTVGKKYITDEGIVKNAHAREIVLTDKALEVIEIIKKNSRKTGGSDYIILNEDGKPTNPSDMWNAANTVYKKAGLSSSISGLHIFRRTFATKMYDAGADIKSIAAYLGDEEATVSKHYIAIRKRVVAGDKTKNVVPVPQKK